MPSHINQSGLPSSLPTNCWLVRRNTHQGSEEYTAHEKATALMMWDYMQYEVLMHGSTPATMVLIWRPESGVEETLASMEINTNI